MTYHPPALEFSPSEHATRLDAAYRAVGDATWSTADFVEEKLAISRDLFTAESLEARRPRPKDMEVVALLSGVPFSRDFVERLAAVQQQISAVLGDRLHYWVAPPNFGLEYCVFKWPMDAWKPDAHAVIQRVLASTHRPPFRFDVRGVQINPDGCVVAKGFDEDAAIFKLRDHLRAEIPTLPARQSGWAHVPMGRILESLGAYHFVELRRLMRGLEDMPIATVRIDSLRLVHETRWYMEERTVLGEYPLDAR